MAKAWFKAAACLGGVVGLALGGAARAQVIEGALLDELNLARAQPAAYAQILANEARSRRDSEAVTDPDAFREAIAFLQRQAPLPPLRASDGLRGAALSHALLQGRTGGFGHEEDGEAPLDARMHDHGVWASLMAENISYGYIRPRDVVRQLIVDSGVPDRGHRANIFDPELRVAGVACAPHRAYGAMCVIDFTGMPAPR